jgi:hypothetical protein
MAFLRGPTVAMATETVVELANGSIAALVGDGREVGDLEMGPPDQPVQVFDEPSLPGTVRMDEIEPGLWSPPPRYRYPVISGPVVGRDGRRDVGLVAEYLAESGHEGRGSYTSPASRSAPGRRPFHAGRQAGPRTPLHRVDLPVPHLPAPRPDGRPLG